MIQIDIDPVGLGRNYPNTIGLMGDAKTTVGKINECLTIDNKFEKWSMRAQELVQQWKNEHEPLFNSDAVPILPERLCHELSKVLPSDAILVSETGHSGIRSSAMRNFCYLFQKRL